MIFNLNTLQCIARIIKGVTYSKKDLGTPKSGYLPILRANNIQNDKLDYNNLVWISKSRISPAQFLRRGDVVVATSSGSKHLVGKTASFDGRQKISCGAFCAILRPNNLVDNLFFKYFFQTQEYRNLISSYAKGSNINNLKNGDLAKIQIPVPPMAEQKRIVRKIEELFGVIGKDIQRLTDTLEQLSQFRQSVLHQAFSGKLYKTTNWQKCKLADIAEINPSTPIPDISDITEISFLPMNAVQEESLLYKAQTALFGKVKKGYTKFKNGDILFAKITPCMENGKACIVYNLTLGIGFGSTEFHILRCSNKLISKFLYYFISQKSFRAQAKAAMSGAVGQQRVPPSFLKELFFSLPTLPEQQKIVDEIEKAFCSADKVQKAVQNALEEAKKLKQSILKKAFAGELVPQDPNDEPVNLPVLKGQTK